MSKASDQEVRPINYIVTKAGFIHGIWKDLNETVCLTSTQALPFEKSGQLTVKAKEKAKLSAKPKELADGRD